MFSAVASAANVALLDGALQVQEHVSGFALYDSPCFRERIFPFSVHVYQTGAWCVTRALIGYSRSYILLNMIFLIIVCSKVIIMFTATFHEVWNSALLHIYKW